MEWEVKIQNYKYTQNSKVLDELLHIGGEVFAAGGACEDVRGAQVHQAVLAEGVAALEDARDFILVVEVVETDGTGYIHCLVILKVN